jgi:2'-5' RNA ligase
LSLASKLYVMLKPPPAHHRLLRGCRSAHGLDDSYPVDRLHNTMLRLGDGDAWSPQAIARLRDAFGQVRFEPFSVTFDQIEGRLLRGRRGMPAPALFHRTLRRHAATCGIKLPEYGFWLHLSLAYKGPSLVGIRKIAPIGWLVEDFRLIRSVEGRGHEELGRWPLFQRQFALAL